MSKYQLEFTKGHLFIHLAGQRWFLDTGSPSSLGTQTPLGLAGQSFEVAEEFLGLTAERVSALVGAECVGLLGTDILRHFDVVFDVAGSSIEVSGDDLEVPGQEVPISEFMGIPLLTAEVRGRMIGFFFDTGAQISYLQDPVRREFPAAETLTDFYPSFGEFETTTNLVDLTIAKVPFTVRAGVLPDLLGMTLMMGGAHGVIGNEILAGRRVGYFPRRNLMVLG